MGDDRLTVIAPPPLGRTFVKKSARPTLRVRVLPEADSWVGLIVTAAAEVLRSRGMRFVVEEVTATADSQPIISGRPEMHLSLVEVHTDGGTGDHRSRRLLEDWRLACDAISNFLDVVHGHVRRSDN